MDHEFDLRTTFCNYKLPTNFDFTSANLFWSQIRPAWMAAVEDGGAAVLLAPLYRSNETPLNMVDEMR